MKVRQGAALVRTLVSLAVFGVVAYLVFGRDRNDGGDGSFSRQVLSSDWYPLVVVGFVVVVFALVGAGIVAGTIADRRRRERLLVFAAERGWQWEAGDERLVDFLPGEPFGRGHGRRVGSVVHGPWEGRQAVAFDYRYRVTSGAGKNRRTRTYRFGLAAVHLPVTLPRVHVGPEDVFHRIAQAFGAEDIDLESHEFNRRYRVEADDRQAAFALLHPRLVETLTQVEQPIEWRTDMSVHGPVVVTWWSGAVEPVDLQRRLALLDTIVDSVPDYVWRGAGWDPAGEGA